MMLKSKLLMTIRAVTPFIIPLTVTHIIVGDPGDPITSLTQSAGSTRT